MLINTYFLFLKEAVTVKPVYTDHPWDQYLLGRISRLN